MHSGVHFKVRHIGLSNVRGRFNRFDAALRVGDTLADTRVEAAIELSSADTNQPDRDAHLLGTDLLSERNVMSGCWLAELQFVAPEH